MYVLRNVIFSPLGHYTDAVNYSTNRRERLPALYNGDRVLEAPIPNLDPIDQAEGRAIIAEDEVMGPVFDIVEEVNEIFPAFEFENEAVDEMVPDFDAEDEVMDEMFPAFDVLGGPIEPLNQMNAGQSEDMIPKAYRNAVVLLDRIPIPPEAPRDVPMAGVHQFESENLFFDSPLVDSSSELHGEEESVVKYEIVPRENDFEEIDGILKDMDDHEKLASENNSNFDQNEPNIPTPCADFKLEVDDNMSQSEQGAGAAMKHCEKSDEAVTSSSGIWNIQVNGDRDDANDFKMGSDASTSNHFYRAEPNHDADTRSFEDNCIIERGLNNAAIPSSSASNTVNGNMNNNGHIECENAAGSFQAIEQFGANDDAAAPPGIVWAKVTVENDESDEDVLYVEPKTSWPAPKTFELDGFVKKENDRFSGDLPYSQKVRIRFDFFFCEFSNFIT